MPRPVIALLLAVSVVAIGCGTGSPPSPAGSPPAPGGSIEATPSGAAPPSPSGAPGAAPSAPADASSAPAGASAGPTTVPGGGLDTGAPPAASLTVVDGDGSRWEGALGTFTWRGVGSDSPWFVPASGASVAPGATLRIRFGDTDVVPASWGVGWATVDGTLAGTPVAGTQGAPGAPVRAPTEPGAYAFRIDADFGSDRRAAWYWRVDVVP